MKILLIGCGNEQQGDDNLGPLLVKDLQQELRSCSEGVEFMVQPLLGACIAQFLREVDVVIFVQARQDESEDPVTIRQVDPAMGRARMGNTSMGATVPDLLQVARDWFGAMPLCYVVQPKGYEFPGVYRLSERARLSYWIARSRVLDIVRQLECLQV
jgi:hydrogenase maturation protease